MKIKLPSTCKQQKTWSDLIRRESLLSLQFQVSYGTRFNIWRHMTLWYFLTTASYFLSPLMLLISDVWNSYIVFTSLFYSAPSSTCLCWHLICFLNRLVWNPRSWQPLYLTPSSLTARLFDTPGYLAPRLLDTSFVWHPVRLFRVHLAPPNNSMTQGEPVIPCVYNVTRWCT